MVNTFKGTTVNKTGITSTNCDCGTCLECRIVMALEDIADFTARKANTRSHKEKNSLGRRLANAKRELRRCNEEAALTAK